MQIADYFFPENSRSQLSVLVLRPMIVKNGMSDIFVSILKANDFLIIERKVLTLNKYQATVLARMEKVSSDMAEMYVDNVIGSPSEVIVVSKIGAVNDARSICHGSTSGRRRQGMEAGQNGRQGNVDSIGAMFEIAPFSSFNEFIDFQDLVMGHSRFSKYQKPAKANNLGEFVKDLDKLTNMTQIASETTSTEIQQYMRLMNLSAFAAPTEDEAHQMLQLFNPHLSQFEEIILILNPLYNSSLDEIEELLIRMQYHFVNKL